MNEKHSNFDWREKLFNTAAVRNATKLILNPESIKPDFVWRDLNDCEPEEDFNEIELIVFDLDFTLVAEGGDTVHKKNIEQFEQILKLREKGLKIACLTNKNSSRNQKIEERYGIKVYTSGKNKKPNPTSYLKIAEENGVEDLSKILFVDDSFSTGIAGAKNLGMKAALVDHKSLLSEGKTEKIWAKRVFGRSFDRFLLRRIFRKNVQL